MSGPPWGKPPAGRRGAPGAPRAGTAPAQAAASPAVRPLNDEEMDRLQTLLDQVPAPLEPLDISMLDGYLCGVLVQPGHVLFSRWFVHVTDTEGRPLPAGHDTEELQRLARRRHAELDAAIEKRQWFDPWVFELNEDNGGPEDADAAEMDRGTRAAGIESHQSDAADDSATEAEGAPPEVQAVYPWVAGFVTALDIFPALMAREGPALNDALVLLYRHLDPDDLEDADDILEAIEGLEPPENLGVAVEELVRATLLLADLGRPVRAAGAGRARVAPRRR